MNPLSPDDSRLVPVDFDPFGEATAGETLPLTEAQREVWAAAQMGPEASCAYNQCYALRLVGDVSMAALLGAIQQLFDRHEALRLTFDRSGESQTVVPPGPVQIPVVDLSGLEERNREARVAEVFAREVETPFDLLAGPVARAQVLVEASGRCVVVFTAHHIACDGGAGRLLFREMALLYAAACRGESTDLGPPSSFRDLVREERGDAGAARAREALNYWRTRFESGDPALSLPLDRARPPVKTYRGARQTTTLDASLTAQLRRAAADQGCTLAALLLAAYQALLYRLTGQPSVVVGLAVSARPVTGGEGPVGHVTNVLPIRIEVAADRPFTDHLLAARSLLLDAHEHSALTFGSLVRELGLPRDPSRTPLVTCGFNLSRGFVPTEFPGADAQLFMPPRSHVNFELEMQVLDMARELSIECHYNADLLDPATVGRWLSHYRTLLEAVVADPTRAVGRLPLLTAGERSQLIHEWNQTARPYSAARCLHELIDAWATRTPDSVAVEFEGRGLTYRELAARSSWLARRLREQGVVPGVRVGVLMERSPEMIVALLGILKAGGAYVPLDPSFPTERLAYMVENAAPAVLLSEVGTQPPTQTVPVMLVEPPDDCPCPDLEDERPSPDDSAYVIYTSGSTGQPKGVEVTHRSLVNLLECMGREMDIRERDVMLSITTLSFDIAAFELFSPLLHGARLVLVRRDEAWDGPRLAQRLASSGATVMQGTPATWRLLLEAGWRGQPGLKILCGGEAWPRELANELLRRAGAVWNGYGPTETTICSTLWQVQPGEGPLSIGRPLANTRTYVLASGMEPVPIGVPGELYIGGAGVARGYWRRPELTMERFVPDPFSGEIGARLYRTGDLVRWLPEGRLDYLGRMDQQVKIRGFRVEVGEIEAVLSEYPGVESAVVVASQGEAPESRLLAFLTGEGEALSNLAALREHLKSRLPAYMMPSSLLTLDRLPLSPTGKVDRNALARMDVGAISSRPDHIPPRTATERVVAAIWAETLDGAPFGVHDDFFEVGGHSLSAARIITRLRSAFGVDVGLRNLFERPTIAGLSGVVDMLAVSGVPRGSESTAAKREEFEF